MCITIDMSVQSLLSNQCQQQMHSYSFKNLLTISDSYHYMLRFNISGLSRQEKPTGIQLHLHLMTSNQPAVINITIGQEDFNLFGDTKSETEFV